MKKLLQKFWETESGGHKMIGATIAGLGILVVANKPTDAWGAMQLGVGILLAILGGLYSKPTNGATS